MTCDEVRELLPEHLLGTLEGPEDLEVRRHLRGCSTCREERMKLEDGVAALSRAVHDQEPPAELRDRVLRTLDEEWQDAGPLPATAPRHRDRSPWRAVAAAAVVVLVAGSLAYGATQARRASVVTADAASYTNLLRSLGGKEFSVGELHPTGGSSFDGQVLVYEGDASKGWDSWAIVFVKAPDYVGDATATLIGADGGALALPTLRVSDGEAHSWIVTADDLSGYDRLTITTPDGNVVATGAIHPA
jgi:hypothetical protein